MVRLRVRGLPPYAVPMRRYSVTEGTRAEIHAVLDRQGKDRLAQGKEDRARAIAQAMAALEDVGDETMVGHTLYRIVEE